MISRTTFCSAQAATIRPARARPMASTSRRRSACVRQNVIDGGLMAYGTNFATLTRQGAIYADKILRGTKPEDLPFEQPTRLDLTINLKTAGALGLTIPESFLPLADEVIE
jgi:putative tryptophan/tyrosine transport system substrate-binding protein